MNPESAEFEASEVLRAIGATQAPEPRVLEDAREVLWSVIVGEMLGPGFAGAEATASERSTGGGEEGRGRTRAGQAGREPDEQKRARGGGDQQP
jgi:hypothetical protein